MVKSQSEITQLLVDWRGGNQEAFDKLYSLVYDELHQLASRYMRRERPDHTLQTTALVHEAYVRLVRQSDADWEDRTHFFAVAAKVMRQVLIDHARTRHYEKRGGNAKRISLEEAAIISDERAEELILLDRALLELEKIDPRQSQIVELRYFGGMTLAETGLKASLGDKHPRTEESLKRLVDLYERWKKPDLAAQYCALLAR